MSESITRCRLLNFPIVCMMFIMMFAQPISVKIRVDLIPLFTATSLRKLLCTNKNRQIAKYVYRELYQSNTGQLLLYILQSFMEEGHSRCLYKEYIPMTNTRKETIDTLILCSHLRHITLSCIDRLRQSTKHYQEENSQTINVFCLQLLENFSFATLLLFVDLIIEDTYIDYLFTPCSLIVHFISACQVRFILLYQLGNLTISIQQPLNRNTHFVIPFTCQLMKDGPTKERIFPTNTTKRVVASTRLSYMLPQFLTAIIE